jgi:hypothetical protein
MVVEFYTALRDLDTVIERFESERLSTTERRDAGLQSTSEREWAAHEAARTPDAFDYMNIGHEEYNKAKLKQPRFGQPEVQGPQQRPADLWWHGKNGTKVVSIADLPRPDMTHMDIKEFHDDDPVWNGRIDHVKKKISSVPARMDMGKAPGHVIGGLMLDNMDYKVHEFGELANPAGVRTTPPQIKNIREAKARPIQRIGGKARPKDPTPPQTGSPTMEESSKKLFQDPGQTISASDQARMRMLHEHLQKALGGES